MQPCEIYVPLDTLSSTHAVLDGIDESAQPGITVNPVDNSFNNPAREPPPRRR